MTHNKWRCWNTGALHEAFEKWTLVLCINVEQIHLILISDPDGDRKRSKCFVKGFIFGAWMTGASIYLVMKYFYTDQIPFWAEQVLDITLCLHHQILKWRMMFIPLDLQLHTQVVLHLIKRLFLPFMCHLHVWNVCCITDTFMLRWEFLKALESLSM